PREHSCWPILGMIDTTLQSIRTSGGKPAKNRAGAKNEQESQPMTTLRLAITADLHFGHNPRGDVATQQLHDALLQEPPDLLLLGGDIGTDQHFGECLAVF